MPGSAGFVSGDALLAGGDHHAVHSAALAQLGGQAGRAGIGLRRIPQ